MQPVKEGATLSCSLGTSTSILQVPESHGVALQGGNLANIADHIGGVNIMSFCKCRRAIPPVGCSPAVTVKWVKGQKECVVDDELTLLEHCIVPCLYGGVIRIVENGQQ